MNPTQRKIRAVQFVLLIAINIYMAFITVLLLKDWWTGSNSYEETTGWSYASGWWELGIAFVLFLLTPLLLRRYPKLREAHESTKLFKRRK